MECYVDGCGRTAKSIKRGLCSMHQARMDRHGDVMVGPPEAPRVCSVIGCNTISSRRSGLCGMHYMRLARHGDVTRGRIARIDREEGVGHTSAIRGDDYARFFDKIEKPLTAFGCWLWMGKPRSNGYGVMAVQGSTIGAHLFAYRALIGPVPEGHVIDHVCHTVDLSCPGGPSCAHRLCVNPFHLEAVTVAENVLRIQRSKRKAHAALSLGDK